MIAPRASVWLRRNRRTKSCRSFTTARKRSSGTGFKPVSFSGKMPTPGKCVNLWLRKSMETFQTLLANKLSDALAKAGLPATGELTPATDARFADYQTNAALGLGRQPGENPKTHARR